MAPVTLFTFTSGQLFLFFSLVTGKNVAYDWTLKAAVGETYSPDCMNAKEFRRSMFLAQDSFPGPLIEAEEGDTITVRIENQNPSVSASIHFHGIHQMGTPFNDGAAYVTQCALGPLQKQEYTFVAYPPGTHYWHDHSSYNIADGLSGPIIIRPKQPDPFTYDEERVSTTIVKIWIQLPMSTTPVTDV
jgi:FtsP/CotA-like multicopper oxidase with cupredoxin domain